MPSDDHAEALAVDHLPRMCPGTAKEEFGRQAQRVYAIR